MDTIECGECKRWLHMRCEGVDVANIPDPFRCASCQAKSRLDDVCPVCCQDAATNVVGCDKCSRWFHFACVPRSCAPDISSNAAWYCHLCSATPRGKESWRTAKALGSLYDSDRDVDRRITLAKAAFGRFWKIWLGKRLVSTKTKLRIYNAFVLPVLTYNLGSLAANKGIESRLDKCHRAQLRRIANVTFLTHPHMTNEKLYELTESVPVSLLAFRARWRLFGHVLRQQNDAPAMRAMFAFFECSARVRKGRPGTCLAQTFANDLRNLEMKLTCRADLLKFRNVAEDRDAWRRLCLRIERVREAEDEC